MSRFNATATAHKTVNKAGGEAFVESPKLELASTLLTSFLSDKFYESGNDTIKRITALVAKVPSDFAAKAALYARDRFNMRSVSHVVAGELLANRAPNQKWMKPFLKSVVVRPDDGIEITSYLASKLGKSKIRPFPNVARKAFNEAYKNFDAYQFGKYKMEGKEINMKDFLRLIHYKKTEKQAAAIDKLFKDELKADKTWQKELTQAGQNKDVSAEEREELKKEVWVKQIKERKIGYFALLRNLRNILEQAPEVLEEALELLEDEKLIRNSRVLPFRFLTAITELQKISGSGVRKVLVSLNKALDISCKNVPEFPGRTLIALDKSGSMHGQPLNVGSVFAAILAKSSDADVMLFHDEAWFEQLNPADSTLTLAQQLVNSRDWGGTNFHAIFQEANQAYDRIIILSDMQGWMGYDAPTKSFAKYKQRLNCNPKLFSFDLNGYGTLQFPENNVYCLAGFSEKVFDLMKLLEEDRQALVNEIERLDLYDYKRPKKGGSVSPAK